MWNDARLLNAVAGLLTALALLAFLFAGVQLLLRSPLFPLREVTVTGDLSHTPRAAVESATQGRIGGNFFAADLAQVRAGFEELPWVRRVDVRRMWPDRLEVKIEEHRALARWGDAGLVNTFGERFPGETDARLPAFAGPAGSEAEVTRRYRAFAAILAPLAFDLERVVLTPRYAWQLRLVNGLALELGRDASEAGVETRLARFVAAYPETLGKLGRRHEYVDLRYPNGFALRISELKG